MKAIRVMFDLLSRHYLEPYNPHTPTLTPNFTRLAQRSIQFDGCYAGTPQPGGYSYPLSQRPYPLLGKRRVTYHTRYSTWENIHGQEGDPWKGFAGGMGYLEELCKGAVSGESLRKCRYLGS